MGNECTRLVAARVRQALSVGGSAARRHLDLRQPARCAAGRALGVRKCRARACEKLPCSARRGAACALQRVVDRLPRARVVGRVRAGRARAIRATRRVEGGGAVAGVRNVLPLGAALLGAVCTDEVGRGCAGARDEDVLALAGRRARRFAGGALAVVDAGALDACGYDVGRCAGQELALRGGAQLRHILVSGAALPVVGHAGHAFALVNEGGLAGALVDQDKGGLAGGGVARAALGGVLGGVALCAVGCYLHQRCICLKYTTSCDVCEWDTFFATYVEHDTRKDFALKRLSTTSRDCLLTRSLGMCVHFTYQRGACSMSFLHLGEMEHATNL